MIGGMPETQEMLDYCAEHNIVSDIELTGVDQTKRSLRPHSKERSQSIDS